MSITIELKPEVEAELKARAEEPRVHPAAPVAEVVEREIKPREQKVWRSEKASGLFEEWDRIVGDKIPDLGDETFSRETIYRDPD